MSDQLDAEYEALVRRFARGINLPAAAVKAVPVDMDALVSDMVAPIDADPCAKTTTAHRRWSRWWLVYAGVTFTTGAVLDVVAYRRHGYPATLTCALRRLAGAEPARYGRVGHVAMGAFLAWAFVHLTSGRLGPTKGRQQ